MAKKKAKEQKKGVPMPSTAGSSKRERKEKQLHAAPVSMVDREARIMEHTTYLENLISMIPPRFYFAPDPAEMAKKFHKHVGKAPQMPKHQRKLDANERRKERLDPAKNLTVPEQQQQMLEHEYAMADVVDPQPKPVEAGGPAAPIPASGIPMSDESLSVVQLKDRLTQRIVALRASRGGTSEGREPAASKVPQAKHNTGRAGGVGCASNTKGNASEKTDNAKLDTKDAPTQVNGGIAFSKLATKGAGAAPGSRKRKRLPELLDLAESKQRMVQHPRNADGGNEDDQIDVWEKAFERAGGIKQRDDPKLLRKTMKRKERQKKKSTKEWKQRINAQIKSQAEKQQKRKANLAARATKNKVRATRRVGRPGFEGKKHGFLNG
mmetsp:Transcript_71537/g.118937  ORF Transcript_71537/g.118937 Transcript_71537/m.118937 type:complete len:380 (+) Transcript_71537:70-1209(+)